MKLLFQAMTIVQETVLSANLQMGTEPPEQQSLVHSFHCACEIFHQSGKKQFSLIGAKKKGNSGRIFFCSY